MRITASAHVYNYNLDVFHCIEGDTGAFNTHFKAGEKWIVHSKEGEAIRCSFPMFFGWLKIKKSNWNFVAF